MRIVCSTLPSKLPLLLIVAFIAFGTHAEPPEKQPHKLEIGVVSEFHDFMLGFVETMINEVYQQNNLELNTINLPSKRSLILSNRGELDGELIRAELAVENTPNILPVPEPLLTISTHYFCISENICKKNVEQLEIGIIAGVILTEKICRDQMLRCYKFYGNDNLIGALLKKRIDTLLVSNLEMNIARKNLTAPITLYRKPTGLAPTNLYHYLHKSHQQLIPALRQSIANYKQTAAYTNLIPKNEHPDMVNIIDVAGDF